MRVEMNRLLGEGDNECGLVLYLKARLCIETEFDLEFHPKASPKFSDFGGPPMGWCSGSHERTPDGLVVVVVSGSEFGITFGASSARVVIPTGWLCRRFGWGKALLLMTQQDLID